MTLNMQEIYTQSTDLLKRFDLQPTFVASWAKFCEEVYEAQQELFELADLPKNHPAKEDAAKEICDVLVTLCNVAYSFEKPYFLFEEFDPLSDMWEDYDAAGVTLRASTIDFVTTTYGLYAELKIYHDWEDDISPVLEAFESTFKHLIHLSKVAGLTIQNLDEAMQATITKNAKKTHDTHHVLNGMIARKPAQEVAS